MKLDDKIAAIVEMHGADFYDTETTSENGNRIFRVYIKKEGGVDLDLCAEISSELSPFLDVHPPMEEAYFLEVSSPGVERPLKKPSHFIKSVGEKVKLKLDDGEKLQGTILSADEESFILENEGEEKRIDYRSIKKAKTWFEW